MRYGNGKEARRRLRFCFCLWQVFSKVVGGEELLAFTGMEHVDNCRYH